MATGEGWLEIIWDGVDSVQVDVQPRREANASYYISFGAFVCLGRLFTMGLVFLGAIHWYNVRKHKAGATSAEASMTEDQKKYVAAVKCWSGMKPLPKPEARWRVKVFDFVVTNVFEAIMLLLVLLNMVKKGFFLASCLIDNSVTT